MRLVAMAVLVVSAGCATPDLCARMATQCGGAHVAGWDAWCRGACVPEIARTVPCAENGVCLLCAPDASDGGTSGATITYFGFPADDIEYLWTQVSPSPDAGVTHYPPSEPAPTGGAFDDRAWIASRDGRSVGAWRALEPVATRLGDPSEFFCEPGPSLFLAANASGGGTLTMRAETLPAAHADLACPAPFCRSGPYATCSASPSACPYGDIPEHHGYGTASEVDRTLPGSTAQASYGYGRYRATLSASGPSSGPTSGTVYAFFSQSSEPCVSGAPNADTNTAEIDVELSASTQGTAGRGLAFCDPSEMCFIVSTWTSSNQGLPFGVGTERHESSGFRFRDRASAGRLHTYGYDWRESDVRFTYDRDPSDCDEAAGTCAPQHASVAICEHTRFIPRRPSPLHVQLWNAWWAGISPPGTVSEMTVTEVWHRPL